MSSRWAVPAAAFCVLLAASLASAAISREAQQLEPVAPKDAAMPMELAQSSPPAPTAGEPLRKRLKPDKPFCFGRDFDQAYLDQHPDQQAVSIRVSRGPDEIAAYAANAKPQNWPNGAEIAVSARMRDEADAVEHGYKCSVEGDQWRCVSQASLDAGCEMLTKEIFLRGGSESTIMLENPSDGLPSLDLCANLDASTSGTKIFELDAMPLSECGLPQLGKAG